MGLLDGILGSSIDDPRTQAVASMVQGLLSSPRPLAGMSAGLLGYGGTMIQAKQLAAQEELRQLQLAQMRQKMDLLGPVLGSLAGGSTSGGQPGPAAQALGGQMGPGARDALPAAQLGPMGAAPAGQQGSQSMLQRMPLDQVTALKLAGLADLTNDWKLAHEGIKLDPGAGYLLPDGSFRAIPNVSANGQATQMVSDPTAPGGIGIITPKGAVDAYKAFQAAGKDVETSNTPVPVDMRERFPGLPASATIKDLLTPATAQSGTFGPVLAAMAANGDKTADFNLGGATGTLTAPAAAGKFKTTADLEAEKLAATGPAALRNKMMADAHTANADYYNKLADTVRTEAEIQNRNAQILPMLEAYKTGGLGAEQRVTFANAIANSDLFPEGMRASLAQRIAGGDPAIGKTIENQLSMAGVKTMLDTLDKEGKPNRAIFQAIQQAQEGINSGNPALRKIFDLQKQLYDWHYGQLQSVGNKLASSNYNPLTFAAEIARERNDSLGAPAAPGIAPAAPVVTHRWNPQTGRIEAVTQ